MEFLISNAWVYKPVDTKVSFLQSSSRIWTVVVYNQEDCNFINTALSNNLHISDYKGGLQMENEEDTKERKSKVTPWYMYVERWKGW